MSTVTITGSLKNAISGDALQAAGWIEPSTPFLVNTATNAVSVGGAPVTVAVDGTFSVAGIVPCDDPNISPQGFTYEMRFRLTTGEFIKSTFYIVTGNAPTVDWSDLVTVEPNLGTAVPTSNVIYGGTA